MDYPDHFMPVYPNGLNASQQDHMVRKQIDASIELYKDAQKTSNKMMESNYRHALACERDARREALKETNRHNQELSTYGLAQDSEGYFMLEFTMPNGVKKFSKPICSQSNLKAYRYYAADVSNEILQIIWDGEKTGIHLLLGVDSVIEMERAFINRGVFFKIPAKKKKDLLGALLTCLINNAEDVEVPSVTGWSKKTTGEWHFETDKANTMGGMMQCRN